jgi:hypothetical protein
MFSKLLSLEDNNKLNQWLTNKDKPLFITGYSGCGKTYLAKQLLKDYHIITINSEYIKHSKDITEHLTSSLLKKDIFMMISSNSQYKSLLIDDIQLFSQLDKPNLTKIYKFIQTLHYKQHPVILMCDETEDKCIKLMKKISYVVDIQFNLSYYQDIFHKKQIPIDKLRAILPKTKNLNTILTTINNFSTILNDINKTNDETIEECLLNTYKCNELFRKCSSDYSIISLNLLENIPYVIKDINKKNIYDIYESVCIDDYMEYKYIQNNLDLEMRLYYSCIKPINCIKKKSIKINKLKYNTYVSRSIIQIHNQCILQNNTVVYLDLLHKFYNHITDINNNKLEDIKYYIQKNDINLKTLEKQMKVFNYYYHKQMNKKQFTKIIKSIF